MENFPYYIQNQAVFLGKIHSLKEKRRSTFTFLGAEKRSGNEGSTLKGEFACYDREITEGRNKTREEMAFVPKDEELANMDAMYQVETNNALSEKQDSEHEKIQGLYRKIFSGQIEASLFFLIEATHGLKSKPKNRKNPSRTLMA
jgi:hypothetical protein